MRNLKRKFLLLVLTFPILILFQNCSKFKANFATSIASSYSPSFAFNQNVQNSKLVTNNSQFQFAGICSNDSAVTIQDQNTASSVICTDGKWSWTSSSTTNGVSTYSFTQKDVVLTTRVLRVLSIQGSFAEGSPDTDTDDIFIFAQGTNLMMVQNPFQASDFTGTQIFSEGSVIQAVAATPSARQAYYVMGGNLYCYAFSSMDENDDCRNRRADALTVQSTNIQMHGVLASLSGTPDKAEWISPGMIQVQSNGQSILNYQIPLPTVSTQNLSVGVNIKMGGDAYSTNPDEIFKRLSDNGFKTARLFLGIPPLSATSTFNDTVRYLRSYLTSAQKYGIKVYLNYQVEWIVCQNDSVTFLTQDQSAIYQNAYSTTQAFVANFNNDIVEWELGNEIDLKAGTSSSPGGWPYGFQAADWDQVSAHGSADYFGNFAAAIKGASDAIAAVNTSTGSHMKRVVNSTGTHLGFWKFLISKGVNFEEISYHYYQISQVSAYAFSTTDPNYPGSNVWNVVGSLAQFHKPVQITEFNCAEIYNGNYQNSVSDPMYAHCMKSLQVQLKYWTHQTVFDLTAIYAYELFDEPSQPASEEQKFGLYFVTGNSSQGFNLTAKSSLSIWQYLAGVALTPSQIADLKTYNVWPLF